MEGASAVHTHGVSYDRTQRRAHAHGGLSDSPASPSVPL